MKTIKSFIERVKKNVADLKSATVWKEGFLVVLILFTPLIVSFLITKGAYRQLSIGAVQFTIANIVVMYLITVLLNSIRPFKYSRINFIASCIVPVVWILIYSKTFHILQTYSSVLNYLGAIWLFLFCYAVNCFFIFITNRFILFTIKILYTLCLFALSIPAIAYSIYVELYQREFDDFVLITILQTNFAEAKSYLLTQLSNGQILSWGVFLLVLFVGLLGFVLRSDTIKNADTDQNLSIFGKREKVHYCVKIVLLIITTGFILFKYHYAMFPFEVYYSLQSADSGLLKIFADFNKNIVKNSSQIKITGLHSNINSGTIILVIGESANSDYMSAFNSLMAENTTPWEFKMRNSENFVFYDHAYSNYPLTTLSLSFALTNCNQYNNIKLDKAVSILNIAKKAGYSTYYYSMQQKASIYDAGVSVIANQADFVDYVCESSEGYDEKILNSLRNILPDKNNFVILHLRGSHYLYSERYPESFIKGKALLFSEANKDYKCSLLYTDYILKNIFEYANNHLKLKSMVYFSDHGEDMNYTHLPNYFTFSMVHIPLWIYLSPEVILQKPHFLQNLKRHQKTVFTNDLVFDTIHGLLQCKSNYYDSRFDLTSDDFCLTLNNAKTMHGKVNVKDDPIWKGLKNENNNNYNSVLQ